MKTDIVFVGDDSERIEGHARHLISRTLAQLDSKIEIIAVKVDHDMALPLGEFDFHCTIQLKIRGGATMRSEARDCDDVLSFYRALAIIVDQFPTRNMSLGKDLFGRVE